MGGRALSDGSVVRSVRSSLGEGFTAVFESEVGFAL